MTILTPAGDIIPALTVGQPPVPPARPMAGTITRQCGPAARWSHGADIMITFLTPAADTAHKLPRQPQLPLRPLALRSVPGPSRPPIPSPPPDTPWSLKVATSIVSAV